MNMEKYLASHEFARELLADKDRDVHDRFFETVENIVDRCGVDETEEWMVEEAFARVPESRVVEEKWCNLVEAIYRCGSG